MYTLVYICVCVYIYIYIGEAEQDAPGHPREARAQGRQPDLHRRVRPRASAKPRRATKEGRWVLRTPPAY